MQNFLYFRRKLAHRLQACAMRRRSACKDQPSGADLKTIHLFERLAAETDAVPQILIDEAAQFCADPVYARRFNVVWDSLSEVVGTFIVPMHASNLVRWMIEQAHFEPIDDGSGSKARAATWSEPAPSRPDASAGLSAAIRGDFTSALVVAGP